MSDFISQKLWELADRIARLEATSGMSERELEEIRKDVRAMMAKDINISQQTVVGDGNQTAGRDAEHG